MPRNRKSTLTTKKQNSKDKIEEYLGEETASTVKEYLGEETASTNTNGESFQSPSTDSGATRYSSLFSSFNTPKRNKNKTTEIAAAKQKSNQLTKVSKSPTSRSQRNEDTTTDEEVEVEQITPSPRPKIIQADPLQISRRTSSQAKHSASTAGPSQRRNEKTPSQTKEGSAKRKPAIPKVYKEIRKLQESTSLQVRKLPFSRLIREILITHDPNGNLGWRITPQALLGLQESAEIYLTLLFEDANRCTIHRDRKTLQTKDIQLVRCLRGPLDPGNL